MVLHGIAMCESTSLKLKVGDRYAPLEITRKFTRRS